MRKWLKGSLAVGLSIALLTGCSFGSSSPKEAQPTAIKVMYYDESQFYQEYGMVYSAVNQNVEIEVVSTSQLWQQQNNASEDEEPFDYNEALLKLIEEEKPDVVMLEPQQYSKLAEEGKLYDLETLMTKTKYNTEGLIPGVIDYMKEAGAGKLYGLPTNFYSQALYYNPDLFDQYNVPYPQDQMTWSEVIQLAQMFPTEGEVMDRVYGLKIGYGGGLNDMVQQLASSEGLQMYDIESLQMTIDTPAWEALVDQAKQAIESNALYYESLMYENDIMFEGDYYARDPFLTGRLAMTVDGNYMMNQIEEAKNYAQDPDSIIDNYDLVTVPVSAQNPDESGFVNYYNIFGITNDSANVDAAWDFLSYITGDDFARVKSKVRWGNLTLRTNYMFPDNDKNYAAFYKLKPSSSNNNNIDYTKLPQQFSYEFYNLMYQEFEAVQNGSKSSKEALSTLQLKGNELLSAESMTDEEFQEFINEQMMNEKGMINEAAGIETTEELVEPAEEATEAVE